MGLVLLGACQPKENHMQTDRQSITFILSTDSPGKNYFTLATEHFTKHQSEKTDIVTSECRSIACVIKYLNNAVNDHPWSTINLIAHGNAKTGLNLYLSDGGHKATPKRMVQEVALASLPQLKANVVDSKSKINLYACGIGTNPMNALSMKAIFRPMTGPWPEVECAEEYIIFRPDENGIVQKLKASYWPYYYKRGYRPSISEIEQQMKSLYPKDDQLWAEILQHPSDSLLTKDYHIPISFTKYYQKKDERPDFNSQEEKEKWAKSQPHIINKLEELNMSYNDFHWRIDKRIIKDAEGNNRYAVKAIGMTTALCFLRVES